MVYTADFFGGEGDWRVIQLSNLGEVGLVGQPIATRRANLRRKETT